MSTYELKTGIRQQVTICIGIISLLIGLPLYTGYTWLATVIEESFPDLTTYMSQWAYLGIFETQITVALIFSLLNCWFNKRLWKKRLFIKILKVPNLNGIWEGKYESSFIKDGQHMTGKITLEIEQSWTHISCTCFFDKSKSYSDIVCLDTVGSQGTVLKFTYKNISEDVSCNLPEFSGYNELRLDDINTMSGNYFTKRFPATRGVIKLTRKDKQTASVTK